MFGHFRRLINRNLLKKSLLFVSLASTIITTKKYYLDEQIVDPKIQQVNKEKSLLRNIQQDQVCKSQQILEGQIKTCYVKDYEGNQYPIIIVRYRNKLYAVGGICTYTDPINPQKLCQLSTSICFNDKLYCPEHGCAYDIKSGSMEYGPATLNLPRFYVEEKNGMVKIFYPQKLPKKVRPLSQSKDNEDYRKVLIMGGDHHAVIGCIDGLRQYGYTGSITVAQSQIDYPYDNQALHRLVPNLKSQIKQLQKTKNPQKSIQKFLEQKVYEKLQLKKIDQYKNLGIDFIFTSQPYRLISKRFFPYISFNDGVKIEYDGLLVATGSKPIVPSLPGLTQNFNMTNRLPQNVFVTYDKQNHKRLIKFINSKQINNLMIIGINKQALEFCSVINKQFPDIKVKVIDFNQESFLCQQLGPKIQREIYKQYNKYGVEFYLNISQLKSISNDLFIKKSQQMIGKTADFKKLKNSIKVQITDDVTLKTDCAVLFVNNFQAETEGIMKGKYSDIDFTKANRIITDPHLRSDTKRIFAAGNCSSMEYFINPIRLETKNSVVAYQQGLTAAFNILALNVPFHYVYFQANHYHTKELLYAGNKNKTFTDSLIMGSLENWDFISVYSDHGQIVGVSASPSRQRQFQIYREAFRLNCLPVFQDLVSGVWSTKLLLKLIKKLNKSGCYKDLIHGLQENVNIADVIWIQRNTTGFANDHPLDEDDSGIQVDQQGYTRQL